MLSTGKNSIRQVENVLIQAGSRIDARSLLQAGVSRSLVLIEARGCIRSFVVFFCHYLTAVFGLHIANV